jgi:hypothetical protein
MVPTNYFLGEQMFILLYMAAAAIVTGGVAVFNEAEKSRARASAKHMQEFERELLEGEIGLAKIRAQAKELGIDPAEAVKGYKALQEGKVTLQDVTRQLGG